MKLLSTALLGLAISSQVAYTQDFGGVKDTAYNFN